MTNKEQILLRYEELHKMFPKAKKIRLAEIIAVERGVKAQYVAPILSRPKDYKQTKKQEYYTNNKLHQRFEDMDIMDMDSIIIKALL